MALEDNVVPADRFDEELAARPGTIEKFPIPRNIPVNSCRELFDGSLLHKDFFQKSARTSMRRSLLR